MTVQLIGETCEDVYHYGIVPRLSPEAPCPIFRPQHIVKSPGMSGNVKANLESLGVEVTHIHQAEPITKARFVEEAHNYCLLRVDDEPFCNPFDGSLNADVPLVVSDYNKGFLRNEHLAGMSAPISFIDTKRKLGTWCERFDFIKINRHEAEASKDFIEQNNSWLARKLIITLGGNGASYLGRHYGVKLSTIVDVTGAGDTFLAAFVAKYLKTEDVDKSINFANSCARLVVRQRGTYVINPAVSQGV